MVPGGEHRARVFPADSFHHKKGSEKECAWGLLPTNGPFRFLFFSWKETPLLSYQTFICLFFNHVTTVILQSFCRFIAKLYLFVVYFFFYRHHRSESPSRGGGGGISHRVGYSSLPVHQWRKHKAHTGWMMKPLAALAQLQRLTALEITRRVHFRRNLSEGESFIWFILKNKISN